MCGENPRKDGTHNAQDYVEVIIFWVSICKDAVGTIINVEGNINLTKYIDILDHNLWLVVLKMTTPRYTSVYRKNYGTITMISIVLLGHPNHQTLKLLKTFEHYLKFDYSMNNTQFIPRGPQAGRHKNLIFHFKCVHFKHILISSKMAKSWKPKVMLLNTECLVCIILFIIQLKTIKH